MDKKQEAITHQIHYADFLKVDIRVGEKNMEIDKEKTLALLSKDARRLGLLSPFGSKCDVNYQNNLM